MLHRKLCPHLYWPLLLALTLMLPPNQAKVCVCVHVCVRTSACVCACVYWEAEKGVLWNISQQDCIYSSGLKQMWLMDICAFVCVCVCVRERMWVILSVSECEHACCFSVVFHVNCIWWPCGGRRHPSKWQSNQNTCPCETAPVITLLSIGSPLCSAKCFMITSVC